MTDEQKKAFIALRIGDVASNEFYPLFTQDEYQMFLDNTGGDIDKAVMMAAISASMLVSSMSTREQIFDVVIENDYSRNYLRALEMLIKNPVVKLPSGLMPWSASDGCDKIQLLKLDFCGVTDSCGNGCSPTFSDPNPCGCR